MALKRLPLKPSIQLPFLRNPQRLPNHVAENPFHRSVISVSTVPYCREILLTFSSLDPTCVRSPNTNATFGYDEQVTSQVSL